MIAASALAWFRRPFRWHLAFFGALLPLGVIGQAILGALVVKYHLAPGLVMRHFILSMLLLDAAFALAWCARYEPGERRVLDRPARRLGGAGADPARPADDPRRNDRHRLRAPRRRPRRASWSTASTSRAPGRWSGWCSATRRSPALFGIAAIAVWLLLRRPGGDRRAQRPLTAVIGLLALQGAVGGLQWALELPGEIVWLHVALATLTWLAMLWTVATAGRLEPRARVTASNEPQTDLASGTEQAPIQARV